jgi:hypothetical protein
MISAALKAKRFFPAREKPLDEQLEAALAELRVMAERYNALSVTLRRQVDWQPLEARVKETKAAYEKDVTIENLHAWMIAELVCEKAKETLGHLYRRYAYGDETQQRFAAEFPDWKKKLLHAAQLRLEKSKRKLETITQQERDRLGDGFDADEIAASPVVRRAQGVVDHWQFRIKNIEQSIIEVCWAENISGVLR